MKDSDWQLLVTLYDKKSMTKAAEALYMTQPALTKKLRAIENEWGIEVVHRSSQGVTFTEDGMYLVDKANVMLDFLNEIREHYSGERTFREMLDLGVPNSFARLHMPHLFKLYAERYDHIQFKTLSASSDVLMQKLTSGALDMAIICGDFPYLGEAISLFEEQLYLITPKNYSIDTINNQPLIESYFNPIVRLTVNQWWIEHYGVLPQGTHKVPYADIAIEMVGNELGVTFVFGDGWKIDPETMQRIPVYDKNGNPVTRRVWLMYASRCQHSASMMEFVDLVREVYADKNQMHGQEA